MKTIEIKGTLREPGKVNSKNLRREEKVPCVMYGQTEPLHFILDEVDINRFLNSPEVFIVKVDLDGKVHDTITREVQFHPVTDRVLHLDLVQINENKAIDVELPIVLIGKPEGVANGGRLVQNLRRVRVNGIPTKLPDLVEVDVSPLKLGDSLQISDADFGDVNVVSPGNSSVASCLAPRVIAEPETEEGELLEEGETGEEGAAEGGEGEGEGEAEKAAEGSEAAE